MTTQNIRLTLDEVLDGFFYSSEKPDAEKLKEALAAYPEYREDIVQFAVLWASYENSEDSGEAIVPSDVPAQNVARIQSFVMGRLHELDHAAVSGPSTEEVDAVKQALKGLAGSALRKAAEGAGFFGSTILLTKILTRSISCVPKRALEGLANYLSVSLEALAVALGQTNLGAARSYKSANKPRVSSSETWESAVTGLTLTPAQKQALLALSDEEQKI
jgi:hypothetical protein